MTSNTPITVQELNNLQKRKNVNENEEDDNVLPVGTRYVSN